MKVDYLVDTSAWFRIIGALDVREKWTESISAGLLSYCDVTELEIVRSVRSKADRDEIRTTLGQMFIWIPMPDRVFDRARQVQHDLVDAGQHRGPGPVDLLIAATAELSGLTLLHYGADFTCIERATNQPMRWLAPRGTID